MQFTEFADFILFLSCLLILLGSIYLTVKTRFVQLRFFPALFSMLRASLKNRNNPESAHSILPHKALFTAMSTTLGISTIVAPVIAMNIGGPGALIGFLLTSCLGSAATYTEVTLSIKYRKKLASGTIMGGPMQYLKEIFSPFAAKWYAVCCLILMTAWSGAQASQIAGILDSPLLDAYRIPTAISGAVIAVVVLFLLLGGIKHIGAFSTALVPVMFVLYIGSSLWILLANVDQLGTVLAEIARAAFIPQAMQSGVLVGGIVSALRWGIFKGIQACEAGIGTQSIPHSMAQTQDGHAQGLLAMLSTYTAGFVAFLSGCVSLITKTWQNPDLPLGISMVAASFQEYFSAFGICIIAFTTLLFAFGTILGNCYNGSQCFGFLTENRKIRWYFVGSCLMVFIGAIADVKTFWSLMDIVLASMALPHVGALCYYTWKSSTALETTEPVTAK